MKLQEYPRLLQPLINCADPPVSTILPFLIALRNAGVVDGTPGCGASPAERVEANRLEVLFGAWVDRNPWAQEFLDPPYTIVIPVAAATPIPNLHLITQDLPAARVAAAPLDPADGAAALDLIESTGTVEDARFMGDLLRTHYLDAAGRRGGPTPQGAPARFRIISFTTHAGGPIRFH